jgi:hypothetical protein
MRYLLRNPHTRRPALRRWLGWTALTVVGWAAAGYAGLPIGRVILAEGSAAALRSAAASTALLGALIGLLTAAPQTYTLRRARAPVLPWLAASGLGWAAGMPIALLAPLAGIGVSTLLIGLLLAFTIGIAQTLLCRPFIPPLRRWLPASLLAYPPALLASSALEINLLIRVPGWGLHGWQTALTAALAGLIAGTITGTAIAARPETL